MIYAVHERTIWLCFWGMSSCTECQMQHSVAVHKFQCHDLETGSLGSLDTDSRTFSEVHSPGISRSENNKVFIDFIDTRNVNEVGPPAQVLLNPHGATRMQQKLPFFDCDLYWATTCKGKEGLLGEINLEAPFHFWFCPFQPTDSIGVAFMVLKKRVWIAFELGELSRGKSLPEAC